MKRILKRLGTIALAALTCLTIGISKKAETASAATSAPSSGFVQEVETLPLAASISNGLNQAGSDDKENTELIKTYPKDDDNFRFISGAALNLGNQYNAEPLSVLRFGMELSNEDLISCNRWNTTFISFTLFRGGETFKPLYRVMIFHAWNLIGMAHSHISGDGEKGIGSLQNDLHIEPSQEMGDTIVHPDDPYVMESPWGQAVLNSHANNVQAKIQEFLQSFRDSNYVWDFLAVRDTNAAYYHQPVIFDEVDGRLRLYFDVELNSYDAQYFLTLDYDYSLDTVRETGSIQSDTRSIGQVLTNMKADGSFDKEIPVSLQEKAETILYSVSQKETLNVEYLERIGETPFARKVVQEITVPVLDKTIRKDDVELQIGKTTDCLGSYVTSFNFNQSRNVYESTYATSMLAYIRRPNGEEVEVFLDINLSYAAYYNPFVTAGYLEEDAYFWMWNNMIAKYSEALSPFSDRREDVYGLYGYALVPRGYEISDIWASVTGTRTQYKSTWSLYEQNTTLRTSQYDALLGTYHQNWFQRTWNVIQNWFSPGTINAKHIFFYGDASDTIGVVSGNGSDEIDNTKSLILNDGEDAVKAVVSTIELAGKTVVNKVKNNPFVKTLSIAFWGVLYTLLAFAILWLVLKLVGPIRSAFSDAKGSGGKNKKK